MSTLMLTGMAVIFILIGMMLMLGIMMLIDYIMNQKNQIGYYQDITEVENPYCND